MATNYQTVNANGLVGKLVIPPGKGEFPAVLCIGGSSGGVSAEIAEPLALEGFVALAIGYFGVPGTPATFADLPMDYFEKAVVWLLTQPIVKGLKVGVTGTSRGSEAALQIATLTSDVGAVVAYVPSSIRWNGVAGKAPWTYRGSPLPYAKRLTEYGQQAGKVVSKVDMYNNVLDKPASCRDAVIEVEKASCPILLISGKDDQLWPSERMADSIMDRLRERNYPYEHRHITYPSAGHRIKVPGLDDSRYAPVSEDTVTHEVLNLGGTLEGNKAASERSFSETVQFFRENLG